MSLSEVANAEEEEEDTLLFLSFRHVTLLKFQTRYSS
jgi:hypothetical protein